MDDKNGWLRLGAVGAAAFLAGVGTSYTVNYFKPGPKYNPVGIVSNLCIYPVKSCGPIYVNEATCCPLGLRNEVAVDRTFIVTDSKYRFITARKENRMVLIKPRFKNGNLLLDAPGMETFELKIPDQGQSHECVIWDQKSFGIDCGPDVGSWLEKFLDRSKGSTRLLYHPWNKSFRNCTDWQNWDRYEKNDKPIYADSTAYMILGEGSLADLNSRLDQPCTYRNFRPNFIVKGSYPYEEDSWKYLKVGNEATFRCVRPCTRCMFTTINPETGIKSDQPLKMLETYRRHPDPRVRKREGNSPIFGKHLGLDKTGVIKVGDQVFAAF